MQGYCISEEETGYPGFSEELCNTCQKCVAICPFQAITVNGKYAGKIADPVMIDETEFVKFLERRRSIKKFKDVEVSKELLEKVISAAKYAPNQNKNISIKIINDRELIKEVDQVATKMVKRLYGLMFGFKPIELLISIFYRDIRTIKAKMKHGGFKHVIYENAQAIILVTGNRKVTVTESSSHYMLASMIYMAEMLKLGTCLMDSIRLTFQMNHKIRKLFGIKEDVLGAMIIGYSDESIVNIPRGYEISNSWNR
jgi:nitroreductase